MALDSSSGALVFQAKTLIVKAKKRPLMGLMAKDLSSKTYYSVKIL